MGLSFGSINTGLPKDIVKQIMEAERIPIKKMEARKDDAKAKEALVGDLIQKVKDLREVLIRMSNEKDLSELKVNTNDGMVDVTANKDTASIGSHQLEVVNLARRSSVMSSGFVSKEDVYIGVGYIQYYLPNGESREVYVDTEHATLNGVAKLINQTEEMNMQAHIVNDGSGSYAPFRLIVSMKNGGDENLVEFPYFYFVDGEEDFFIEMEREAQDAKVMLDGFPVEVPTNTTSDLIPGLTIDLKKAKPGEEFTVSVVQDKDAVMKKFDDLIEKINAVLQFINEQNKMDENTNTKRTLGGDSSLQSLESRLRAAVFQPIMTEEGPMRFGDLGVSFQRNGLLDVDRKRFESQIAGKFQLISQVLTGWKRSDGVRGSGFIANLKNVVDGALRFPSGIISSRQKGIQSKISQIDRQIEQRERILGQREKMLKDKFARLETTISKIKNQGSGLAALGAQSPQLPQLG